MHNATERFNTDARTFQPTNLGCFPSKTSLKPKKHFGQLKKRTTRKLRAEHPAVHGIAEEIEKLTDERRVKRLLEGTHTKASIKHCVRLGQATVGKCRPMKIVLSS